MARRTIRVDIPSSSPDSMIQLALDIKEHHDDPKTKSPLKPDRVDAMAARATTAKEKRKMADDLDAQAVKLRAAADVLIGTAPGQTSDTVGTLLNDVTGLRDSLKAEFRGQEDELGEYGFDVVIGAAAVRTRSPAKKNGQAAA